MAVGNIWTYMAHYELLLPYRTTTVPTVMHTSLRDPLVYTDSFSEFECALLGSIFSLAFVSKPDVQVRSVLFEEVFFL